MQNIYWRNDNRRAKVSLQIYTSQFICKVRKGCVRFYCERELETEQNCNILTPTFMAVSVVSFSFSRAAQPETQRPTLLGDGFLYCILSATSLDPNSSGAPRAPLALCDFPYHISSLTPTVTVWLLSGLSYIIVQRPLNRLLDLWNGMFDRYQAEITVMQFTGLSLPVHKSMSVPWEF